jgi:GntR family transcriptional regulator
VSVPLHRHLADGLRAEIRAGAYPPGSRLPSEPELAARHRVARGTVRQALAALRDEGLIVSRRGARAVVLEARRTQSFSELQSFTQWARSLGAEPAGRVVGLEAGRASADDERRLGVPAGTPVHRLVRVRLLGDLPVMVERTTFAPPVGAIVATLDLARRSIYEELEARGVRFARARHLIAAIPASSADARLLGVPRRTPLLRDLREGLSETGAVLEWSDDRYRGDEVAFSVDNTARASTLGRHRDPALAGAA